MDNAANVINATSSGTIHLLSHPFILASWLLTVFNIVLRQRQAFGWGAKHEFFLSKKLRPFAKGSIDDARRGFAEAFTTGRAAQL